MYDSYNRYHQELSLNHLHPYFGTGTLLSVENKTEGAKYVRKAISHLIDRDEIVNIDNREMGWPGATIMDGWVFDRAPRAYSVDISMEYMMDAGFNYTDLGIPDDDGRYPAAFYPGHGEHLSRRGVDERGQFRALATRGVRAVGVQ